MITLITGAPGSGKSAALVSLLAEISKYRTIYVSGIPDLKIEHEELADPTTWPDTVPDGAVIVIDEVQRVWRPRGPGQKVPSDIAALETHRHRGIDFYVVTQAPRLVDSNIRALVGRHVHLRDVGLLGRWWYEWPEVSEQCAASWRTAPIKKRYKLPKAIFGQYKSASVHIKPIRSVPWVLFLMFAALVGTVFMVWKSASIIQQKGLSATPAKPLAASSAPVGAPPTQIQSGPVTQARVIDDRVDWIPRVSNRPESAPAYDALRVVVNMPVVVGGVCMGEVCKCVTQQGTDAGLSAAECRKVIQTPPFDPYTVRPVVAALAPSPVRSTPAAAPVVDDVGHVPASVAPPPPTPAQRLQRQPSPARQG